MDPGTAGTVGFVIRLMTIVAVTVVALRIAGLRAETLASGAFTAVIVGLAAQQTIGNLFAGIVLQGARPFRVGERVGLQGGPMAGTTEGTVGSLGLFYTTFVNGADRMLVPNSVLLQLAVVPMREPDRVDLRARFDSRSARRRSRRCSRSGSPSRPATPPQIELEEVDRDEVVLRITATPDHAGDGAKLAEEVLAVARAGERRRPVKRRAVKRPQPLTQNTAIAPGGPVAPRLRRSARSPHLWLRLRPVAPVAPVAPVSPVAPSRGKPAGARGSPWGPSRRLPGGPGGALRRRARRPFGSGRTGRSTLVPVQLALGTEAVLPALDDPQACLRPVR